MTTYAYRLNPVPDACQHNSRSANHNTTLTARTTEVTQVGTPSVMPDNP